MAADYSVKKSDAEWKKELDPLQHHVLRDHGTERPFTSPLTPTPSAPRPTEAIS